MANWKLDAKAIKKQIADAKEQTRINEPLEPRAKTATYDPGTNRVVVVLNNGADFSFSASTVPELGTASPKEIAQIEISPSGRTLRWKALDADLSLPGLMMGVFGSKLWMAQLGQKGGQTTSIKKAAAARLNGKKGGRPTTRAVYATRAAYSSPRGSSAGRTLKSVAATVLTRSTKTDKSPRVTPSKYAGSAGKLVNKSKKK